MFRKRPPAGERASDEKIVKDAFLAILKRIARRERSMEEKKPPERFTIHR